MSIFIKQYVIIVIGQIKLCRDSSVIALFGNGKEEAMNIMEVLTLLLVVFTALDYIENHHNKK